MIIPWPIAVLKQKPRPITYIDEMRACAQNPHSDPLLIDDQCPAYIALQDKYRHYQPTPNDLERMLEAQGYDPDTSPESPRNPSCCGSPPLK